MFLETLLKIEALAQVFPVNSAKFLRHLFYRIPPMVTSRSTYGGRCMQASQKKYTRIHCRKQLEDFFKKQAYKKSVLQRFLVVFKTLSHVYREL